MGTQPHHKSSQSAAVEQNNTAENSHLETRPPTGVCVCVCVGLSLLNESDSMSAESEPLYKHNSKTTSYNIHCGEKKGFSMQ